jgi:hypothetical protein
MKSKSIFTILMTLTLCVFSAAVATAQKSPTTPPTAAQATTPSKDAMAHDQMMMSTEPNYVLATAYHQSMLVFAKALNHQAVGASPVNVEFARDAVTEMRRSFDKMKKYNEEYMETISAEVRTSTAPMMQQMETQRADLNVQLTALEKEVALDKPDAKKLATLTTAVQTNLDAMSKLDENPMSKLTMKM